MSQSAGKLYAGEARAIDCSATQVEDQNQIMSKPPTS